MNGLNYSTAEGACIRSRKTSCDAETVWSAASVTHCIHASDVLDSGGPPECPQSNVWCGWGPKIVGGVSHFSMIFARGCVCVCVCVCVHDMCMCVHVCVHECESKCECATTALDRCLVRVIAPSVLS